MPRVGDGNDEGEEPRVPAANEAMHREDYHDHDQDYHGNDDDIEAGEQDQDMEVDEGREDQERPNANNAVPAGDEVQPDPLLPLQVKYYLNLVSLSYPLA